MTDINEVMGRLNPKLAKRMRLATDMEIERQPLPSLGLTKALGGGFRYGSQVMLWGNRSSAKTMLALQTIALAQKQGKSAAIIDAEGSLTPEWLDALGVDRSQLIWIPDVKTISQATDEGVKLISAGIDILLIDSISVLLPGSFFEKNGEMKEYEETNQIGQFARGIGKMCGAFNYVNDHTLVILVSQVTTGIYNWGAMDEPQGGKKAAHLNNTSIKLTSSLTEKNQIKGVVHDGNRTIEKVIGRPVNWKIDKDRGPSMGETGSYDIYTAGDFIGIDNVGDLVDYAVECGVIEQGGAWFTVEGQRVQGRANVVSLLREDPALCDTIERKVLGGTQ